MTKLIRLLVGLFCILIVIQSAQIQAQEPTPKALNTIGFVGVRYDDKALFSGGFGTKIAGSVYNFTYADLGEYNALNTEIAYLRKVANKAYFGPVMGPNVDWVNNPQDDPIAYLVGTAGLVAGYDLSETFGLWFYGKYKLALKDKVLYKDGAIFGVGVFLRL